MQKYFFSFFILFSVAFLSIQAQDKNFAEEGIIFTNGENVFSGTLSIPKGNTKFPVVVFISGRGSQTRESNTFGFKIFETLSNYFANRGIAVLRYDDRNTGESRGTNIGESTLEDLADDVVQAVKYLSTRPEIDPQKIGLLGYDEGGIIAPLAHWKEPNIAFTILLAGIAINGGELILTEKEAILKANSVEEEHIQEELTQHKKFQEIAKNNENWDTCEQEITERFLKKLEKLSEEQKNYIGDFRTYANTNAKMQLAPIKSKWYKSFIEYDPKPALEKLTCPTLALFGELDIQVSAEQNIPIMEGALRQAQNRDFTIKILKKTNHLFQEAKTGSITEYANLQKDFTSGFLDYTTFWIQKRFGQLPILTQTPKEKLLTGMVSYYNDKYQGKPTASGEKYDKNKLTAASHKTFAFGTMLEVTNTLNGKKVIVKVNDRLGKNNTHILDLSREAATTIEMIDDGIVPVTVKVLKK